MKLSARNVLPGKVVLVTKGATTAHVKIDLGGGRIVTASITNEAVRELGLKKGDQAYAVIKASDVMLAGNIPGKTTTAPLAIYTAVQTGERGEALLLVGLLTALSCVVLIAAGRLGPRAV